MKKTTTAIFAALSAALAFFSLSSCKEKTETLNLLVWEGYADPLFTKEFEEKYGVQPKVTETDNGAKIDMEMTAEQAKEFYGNGSTKATRKEVIEEFEKQGFTCE